MSLATLQGSRMQFTSRFLPDDVQTVGVNYCYMRRAFLVCVRSDAFPVIPYGDEIPILHESPIITTIDPPTLIDLE